MNLHKYLALDRVVEDMNGDRGRYVVSEPGWLPRFEKRKLGARRKEQRHIVFSAKSAPHPAKPPAAPPAFVSAGTAKTIRVASLRSLGAGAESRRGVVKRTPRLRRVPGGAGGETGADSRQPDLFETYIPVRVVETPHDRWEARVDVAPSAAAMDEPMSVLPMPARRPGWWKRLKRSVDRWLRNG